MVYEIKRGSDTLTSVHLLGKQTERVLSVNIVQAEFSLTEPVEFTIGDYISVLGKEYYLNELPTVAKNPSDKKEFKYTATFEAIGYLLGNVQYMFLGDDNSLKEADFALMGNADTFVDLIIANANRVGMGWEKGVIADTDYRNLTFSAENCLSVLNRLAQEFQTEYWIDGKTIHLTRKGETSELQFEYGKDKGLKRLTRNNKGERICTRLYAFGGDKNIPGDYRNYSNRLKLPNGLFLENNVDKFGIIEHTEIFSEIYPKREGTVTELGDSIYSFYDSGIDFDVNQYLLPGIDAKLTFNTGQLAGYQFLMPLVNGFNNSEKKFTFSRNEDEKAIEIPSEFLRPQVGDKYVLTDIFMPQSYIDAAEFELQVKAQEYLDQNSAPRVLYAVECDPIMFRKQAIYVRLGDYVKVIDSDLGIDKLIRVMSLTRDLQNPYLYTLELADTVTLPSVVRQYAQQEQLERVIRMNRLTDPNRARFNYKTSVELRKLIFDVDGDYFSEAIKPLIVETVNLTVGTKAQQFILNGIVFTANADGNVNRLKWTSGTLDHFTIAQNVRSWNISAGLATGLESPIAYYLYAKCERVGTQGTILVSQQKIKTEENPAYFHFLIGVLHSVIDNVRGISLTYGQTTINGRFVTTGIIRSQDGQTYFDLDKGEIGGNIIFKADNGSASSINGDVITTGSILLTDPEGINNAGITGKGAGDGAVRFWAGASFDDRYNAPFRVNQDGTLYTNKLLADGGTIGGWDIDQYGLKNNTEEAYFEYKNGAKRATFGKSPTTGWKDLGAVGVFEDNTVSDFGSVALLARASGSRQNLAFVAEGTMQHIGALRIAPTVVAESSYTCTSKDRLVISTSRVSNGVFYLPQNPQGGEVIEFIDAGSRRYYIHGNNWQIHDKGSRITQFHARWYEKMVYWDFAWYRLNVD